MLYKDGRNKSLRYIVATESGGRDVTGVAIFSQSGRTAHGMGDGGLWSSSRLHGTVGKVTSSGSATEQSSSSRSGRFNPV